MSELNLKIGAPARRRLEQLESVLVALNELEAQCQKGKQINLDISFPVERERIENAIKNHLFNIYMARPKAKPKKG